jgi:hypothetical protein
MTVDQCAKRADAFGYSLFGITWYEDDPSRGYTCWGGEAGTHNSSSSSKQQGIAAAAAAAAGKV